MVYKSKEFKDFVKRIRLLFITRDGDLMPVAFPWPTMVEVRLEVRMAQAGCDLPNRLKVLFDALQGYVWNDDEQVAVLGRTVRTVSRAPGVTLHVKEAGVDRYGALLPGYLPPVSPGPVMEWP